ncbi:MAG TPA: protein kinase [Nannocystaceae bacterium]|nr:protein kinase [Nannocystaceae bacterium]
MSALRGGGDDTLHSRAATPRPDDVATVIPGRAAQVSNETTMPGLDSEASVPGDPSASHSEILQPGRTIGHFVVQRLLGAGAMGVVVLAHDHELDRPVAIKLLRSDDRGVAQARLLREAQSVARVAHPNVVAVHQVGMFAEQVYLVMEFVDGGTLREWIAAAEREWSSVLEVYRQAGRGLAAAHAAGLVHRDFKPDNVLIGRDGRVRVSDFGLVGVAAESASTMPSLSDSRDSKLTRTGSILGTPAYMAPEQYGGGTVDARSDQFAFCVSLFEALHGVRPFAGESLPELLRSIEAEAVRPPARSVPPWITDALRKGLRATPAERHASVDALLAALEPPAKRTGLRVAIAAGAATLTIAGIATTTYLLRDPEPSATALLAPATCPDPADAPGDPWSDERREDVRAALTKTGHRAAADVFTAIDAELSARRDEWRAELDDACRAQAIRGEQTPAIRQLRERCIAAVRDEADVFAELLAGGDERLVDGAISSATLLTPASTCHDVEALQAAPAPTEAQLADLRPLRRELTRAEVLLLAGRHHDVIALGRELEPELRRIGFAADHAAALLVVARAEMQTGELTSAETHLRESIALAAKGRAHSTEAIATATLMYVVATGLGRPQEALGMIAAGQAAAERSGDPRARSYFESAAGTMWLISGKTDDAMRASDEAIAVLESLPRPPPDELGMAYSNRAGIKLRTNDSKGAIADHTHGLEIIERGLGKRHPFYGALAMSLGRMLKQAGDPEGARARARDALESWEAAFGRDHTSCALALLDIAQDEMALQHWDAARTALDDALARHERSADGAGDLRSRVDLIDNRAFVDYQTGRFADAYAGYERARTLVVASAGEADPRVAGYDRALASVRISEARYDDALPLLERARDALVKQYGPTHAAVADAIGLLAEVELAARRCDQALVHFRGAIKQRNELEVPPDAGLARLLVGMAACELESGDAASAGERLDQAEPLLAAHPDPAQSARIASVRAELAWRAGDREAARASAIAARDGYAALGAPYELDRGRVAAWLEAH